MSHDTLSFKRPQISGGGASILKFSTAREAVLSDSLFDADGEARGTQLR